MHRLDEPRMPDFVVQRITDLTDRLRERRLGDDDATPDGVEKLLLRDENAGALREVAEHGPGLGPQRDGLVARA